jgi:hypothetical protein
MCQSYPVVVRVTLINNLTKLLEKDIFLVEHRITFHTGSQLSYMAFPTLIINKKTHTAVTAPVPSLLPRLFACSMQCKMPFTQIFSL